MSSVLVTGGAGYIGSHTVLLLLEAGYSVVVLDNLSNSSRESLNRVERLTGKSLTFIEGDIRDSDCLKQLFSENDIASVIHFAGLKAVGESVAQPLRYYDCNVTGTLRLLEAMDNAGVQTLVFSSSAICIGVMTPGGLHCFAISILPGLTKAVKSGKTPMAFRITLCRSLRRWR